MMGGMYQIEYTRRCPGVVYFALVHSLLFRLSQTDTEVISRGKERFDMENNVMQKVSYMTSKAFLCPIPMVFVEETCGYVVSDSHPSQATIILGYSSVPECKRSSHLGLLIVYIPSREGHVTLSSEYLVTPHHLLYATVS